MKNENGTGGVALLILQIAVGLMLAIGGIWALLGHGDMAANAVRQIFSGDLGRILFIVFGVVELLVGIFTILKVFSRNSFGFFGSVLKFIALAAWILAVVLADVLGAKGVFNGAESFLGWLYAFAKDLIVLGALLAVR
jgi:hypothetical protein